MIQYTKALRSAIVAWCVTCWSVLIADMAINGPKIFIHYTQWTFLFQNVMWTAVAFVEWTVPKYKSHSIHLTYGYLLPIVLPIQLTVFIGVNVVILDTRLAKDAITEYGKWATWIYNFYVHTLLAFVSLGYGLYRRRLVYKEQKQGWVFTVNIMTSLYTFLCYNSIFSLRRVYEITWRPDVAFVGMIIVLVVCSTGVHIGVATLLKTTAK